MRTLSDLLRDADPLRDEGARPARARQQLRDAVVSAPRRTARRASTRFRVAIATGIVLLAGIAMSKLASKHTPAGAVTALHFEARLAAAQESIVDNQDILTARVVPGSLPTTFGIELTFTPEGAEKMRRATEAHIGERLDLLIDGDVVLAPTIRGAISGSATLTGDYTFEQANRIAEGLLQGKVEVRSQK